MKNKVTVAAVQMDTKIGDIQANIATCKRLALEALEQGATWIALPEFFTTGVAWDPSLVKSIEDEAGHAATFLREFSKQHSVVLGGSFLCRVPEGGVRNRYLCFYNGNLIGKHDKDYATMWENAFYEGGDPQDTGELGTVNGVRIGAAVCWEFLRTATSRRLQHKVDVLMGGSHWWSIPSNWPRWLQHHMEPYNNHNALVTVQETARLIGAPVIHASHCHKISCPMPGLPIKYSGQLEGHAAIIDAKGKVLASRHYQDGEGIVVADIILGAVNTKRVVPEKFWLRRRGLLPTFSWHYQGFLGRRWYAKNVR